MGTDEGDDFTLAARCSEKDCLGKTLFRDAELFAEGSRLLGWILLLRVLMFVSDVGVLEPMLPFLLPPMTLLAGELPGVSIKLLLIDRSLEMTVDTESRRFISCRS